MIVRECLLSKWSCITLPTLASAALLVATSVPSLATQQPALVIETVPALEGIPFQLEGQRFVTDENGVAQITPSRPGVYEVSTRDHILLDDQRRAEFATWSDGVVEPNRDVDLRQPVLLQIGFHVDHLVEESFRAANGKALSPGSIGSFVIVDDTGAPTTFSGKSRGMAGPTAQLWERFPPGTRWLRAVRVVVGDDGLSTEQVSYEVQSLSVNGEDAHVFSHRFVPSPGAEWVIAVDPSAATTTSPLVVAGGAIAVLVLGLLGLFAFRRIRNSSRPLLGRVPFLHRGSARHEVQDEPGGTEFVRVVLRNGRTVEGWRTHVPGDDQSEAVTIQVTSVQGPDGQKVATDMLDYWFLLPAQIDRIETLPR
jgi:hypothetical protein